MSLLSGINHFIGLFLDSLRSLGRGRIWFLLLLNLLINLLVLYSHYDFQSPIFYGVINWWTNLFDSGRAIGFTHYPGHLLLLPYFNGWAKFFVSMAVEGAILGGVAVAFFRTFVDVGKRERQSVAGALWLWVQLILAWLLVNGLILLVNTQLPDLVTDFLQGSPRRQDVFDLLVLPSIYVVILALFYFAIPFAAIYRTNIIKAAGNSIRIFFQRPITCLALAAFMLAVPVIIGATVGQQELIVDKFKPELIYWLLLVGLVVDVFVNFFWMGTAARVLAEEE